MSASTIPGSTAVSRPPPPVTSGPLDLSVHEHIAAIDPAEWDSILDPDDLQATHRFVRACQEARIENAQCRHVVIRRDGVVEATASFCCFHVPLDVLATGLTRRIISTVRRVRYSALRVPVVFCGLPVSFGRSCLRFAPHAQRDELIAKLAGVAEQFAEETGARLICFKEFTESESAALEPLLPRGYFRAPSLPSSRLPLPWRSIDDYAAAMRANYRRQLVATRQARAVHGLDVRTERSWRAHAGRIYALYQQVINRAEFKLERLPVAFFERLAELLPESSAILVEREGTLVSAAIVLDGPSESTFLLVGMDYAVARKFSAYHVIVDEVIAHAIAIAANAVELGQTSWERKARVGAVLSPRSLFVRWRGPIGHTLLRMTSRFLFPVITVRQRRVFREVAE